MMLGKAYQISPPDTVPPSLGYPGKNLRWDREIYNQTELKINICHSCSPYSITKKDFGLLELLQAI